MRGGRRADHKATAWKTLSVFIRDCVGGACFPIDSRVENLLRANDLPVDERLLVHLSLSIGRDPRELARMFYSAGEKAPTVAAIEPAAPRRRRPVTYDLADGRAVTYFVDDDAGYHLGA